MTIYDHYGDVIEPGHPKYHSCLDTRMDFEKYVTTPDLRAIYLEKYHVPLVWEKAIIDGFAHWSAKSVLVRDGEPLYWRLDPVVEHEYLQWLHNHDGVLRGTIHGEYLGLSFCKRACNEADDLIRAGLAGEGYPAITLGAE